MKKFIATSFFLVYFSLSINAQGKYEAHKKLEFFTGNWLSTTENLQTGNITTGNSSVKWILNKKWMEWKYFLQTQDATIEILTLMNYNVEKQQYAFYSFNPFEDEPMPHYGKWSDKKKLTLTIITDGKETQIEFIIKDVSNFDQIHYTINKDKTKTKQSHTKYIKTN